MKPEIVSRLFAGIVLFVAAFGCAIQLYGFASQRTKRSLPIAAMLIIGITAVITGLQFIFPEILAQFRRSREALLAGEWWRMVTPLFVQAAGWPQVCINGFTAVTLCPLTERLYGKRLLALYFIPGVLGEIFGYLWDPNFAGSSLGIAGVMGGLFAFAFLHRREVSRFGRLFPVFGCASAIALCFSRDTLEPPVLIGFLLAIIMAISWPKQARERSATRRDVQLSDD